MILGTAAICSSCEVFGMFLHHMRITIPADSKNCEARQSLNCSLQGDVLPSMTKNSSQHLLSMLNKPSREPLPVMLSAAQTRLHVANRLLCCCRYEGVGKSGYHGLYRWYCAFEAQHFPDPMAVRDKISAWTLHFYPGVLNAAMTIFDLPEAIAVSRTTICSSGIAGLTRLQVRSWTLL